MYAVVVTAAAAAAVIIIVIVLLMGGSSRRCGVPTGFGYGTRLFYSNGEKKEKKKK